MNKQDFEDLFDTAYEGSAGYWAGFKGKCPAQRKGEMLAPSERWFRHVWDNEGTITVLDAEDRDNVIGTITKESMERAVEIMKADHTGHYVDILNESADGETADVFLQLSALGEVVYG